MRRSIYEMDIENEKKWAVREGKEEGRKAGLKEGREKGLKEGRKEGREVGLQEGIKKGKENGILTLVKSLLSLKIDPQVIKQQLIENYHLDKDEAVKYLNKVK